jgi:hypothetical protein
MEMDFCVVFCAMVAASVRLRGIHPPDNIQNGRRPGGECLSNTHWLGPFEVKQHFANCNSVKNNKIRTKCFGLTQTLCTRR